MALDRALTRVYREESSITFISGRRGFGKTAAALRIAEDGLKDRVFDKIAGNVEFRYPDTRFHFICYYDLLEKWLQTIGRKIYVLDELGKEAYRMDFLSQKSKMIMKLCQLVRKYDAHLVGIAPSEGLINKLFLNTDILDLHIKKLSKKLCKVKDLLHYDLFYLYDFPNTTFPFKSKYVAEFGIKSPEKESLETLPFKKKVAMLYLKYRSLRKVGRLMDLSHEEIRKIIDKYLVEENINVSTVNLA